MQLFWSIIFVITTWVYTSWPFVIDFFENRDEIANQYVFTDLKRQNEVIVRSKWRHDKVQMTSFWPTSRTLVMNSVSIKGVVVRVSANTSCFRTNENRNNISSFIKHDSWILNQKMKWDLRIQRTWTVNRSHQRQTIHEAFRSSWKRDKTDIGRTGRSTLGTYLDCGRILISYMPILSISYLSKVFFVLVLFLDLKILFVTTTAKISRSSGRRLIKMVFIKYSGPVCHVAVCT